MSETKTIPANPETYGRELSGRDLDQLAVNTIRGLAMDAVEKAKSGHPGMPMGMADAAFVLWTRFLRHTPTDPHWFNRDRFVLSAGHGSMLLYALLHLSGYALNLEDLKQFRQWESLTPGHPERNPEIYIETTTGPLGQGFANGVGMALAEAMLAAEYNHDGEIIVDHHTYGICSDGDMMEGISHEAASMAGHLGLHKLIYLYDDNHITIEGDTALAYSDDVAKRFEGYNWRVQRVDGHDRDAVEKAIQAALAETKRPNLIICRTHIAYGSPNKQDTAASHGEPLGEEEVRLSKKALGFPIEPTFFVPTVVRELFTRRRREIDQQYKEWKKRFSQWQETHPDSAAQWRARMARVLLEGIADRLPQFEAGKQVATRDASGQILQVLSAELPGLAGGSGDLAPSTKTLVKATDDVKPGDYRGRNLRFGIREHGMGGILNGMSIHGGFIPYGATFLVFSDYMRPSIRLAAIMEQQVIYVFTHDSVFLGEDGPTHEPIEHLLALRAIPNLLVIRPADANETAVAWIAALQRTTGPTALALTRQKLPTLNRNELAPAEMLLKGGYILLDMLDPEIILLATGSEVHVAVAAAKLLAAEGRRVRVVNMASWRLFEEQSLDYRQIVLPPTIKRRLAIEAGISLGWARYVGNEGEVHGIERFGYSAPWEVIAEKMGFTPEAVAEHARRMLAKS